MASFLNRIGQLESLNFLLTNRIPRRMTTQLMGRFSRIRSKRLTRLTLKIWQLFSDELNFDESEKQEFDSLHDCFIRKLKPGARIIDKTPSIITSPCDGIIGAMGKIDDLTVFQAKGYPYEISELIPDTTLQEKFRNGYFITLRLQSTMYHRFHAPVDCKVDKVNYISGDTWNVNPIALARIEKLYCKNERAVIELHLKNKQLHLALVPVAAILVASMKFNCINEVLDLKYRGENVIDCNASYSKGDELGYFQHGSTIIVFSNQLLRPIECLKSGQRINMGEPLMQFSFKSG